MSAASVTVTLPDGTQKQTPAGTPIADFVRDSIGAGLAKAAVLAKANGTPVDLSRTLDEDTNLEILTTKIAAFALEIASSSYSAGYAARSNDPEELAARAVNVLYGDLR